MNRRIPTETDLESVAFNLARQPPPSSIILQRYFLLMDKKVKKRNDLTVSVNFVPRWTQGLLNQDNACITSCNRAETLNPVCEKCVG